MTTLAGFTRCLEGNTVGQETRSRKEQVANPAGRPPDKLRRFLNAELEKIGREATDKNDFRESPHPLIPMARREGFDASLCS